MRTEAATLNDVGSGQSLSEVQKSGAGVLPPVPQFASSSDGPSGFVIPTEDRGSLRTQLARRIWRHQFGALTRVYQTYDQYIRDVPEVPNLPPTVEGAKVSLVLVDSRVHLKLILESLKVKFNYLPKDWEPPTEWKASASNTLPRWAFVDTSSVLQMSTADFLNQRVEGQYRPVTSWEALAPLFYYGPTPFLEEVGSYVFPVDGTDACELWQDSNAVLIKFGLRSQAHKHARFPKTLKV